jgi:hypothetical protein
MDPQDRFDQLQKKLRNTQRPESEFERSMRLQRENEEQLKRYGPEYQEMDELWTEEWDGVQRELFGDTDVLKAKLRVLKSRGDVRELREYYAPVKARVEARIAQLSRDNIQNITDYDS